MGYKSSQDFYASHEADFHLDRWESYMARWIYLDRRGKKRPDFPRVTESALKKAADRLVDNGETRLSYQQMFRTLERAVDNVQDELAERVRIRRHEVKLGVRVANSLAISKLDISIVRILRSAGFYGRTSVKRATNDQLLSLSGIDRARLRQIRALMPHASAKKVRQEALATNGQRAFNL